MGLGNGGGIMVGNELGAGKLEKAKEYGRRLCHLSVSSGIVSGLVLLAFSPLILRAANLSVTAEGYLKGMLLICAYYMIGRSVNGVTISGIFCAGGDLSLIHILLPVRLRQSPFLAFRTIHRSALH